MKIPTLSRSMVFFCAFSSEGIIINPPLTEGVKGGLNP